MSEHTPGPWAFDGPAENIIVWSGPDNRVCFMTSDGPAEANARLIAAAPELLRFVEKVRDYARDTDDESLYAAADDLIEKVEGRS